MNKYGFIYITINTINEKMYIGQCKYRRQWESYLGSGAILSKAIKKYGSENFRRIVIEECDSKEELNEAEKKWIWFLDAVKSEKFYNIAIGGQTAFNGEKLSDEHIKNISKALKGVKKSEEHKRKISEARIKKGVAKGSNNPRFGKPVSEETRERIRQANIGQIPVNKGIKTPQEIINKRRNARTYATGSSHKGAKKVVCLNTLEIFSTLKEASEFANTSTPNLIRSCKSSQAYAGKHPVTNEKLKWKYYENYELESEEI